MRIKCTVCRNYFDRSPFQVRRNSKQFCSLKCYRKFRYVLIKFICTQCGKNFVRRQSRASTDACKNKSGNYFCSKSCAATYNNLHKTTGTRRSKLEVWLEEQLRKLYPNLEILFNAKKAINAELDIYFPTIDLAFELNGIYHYKPIHGETKLASIQSNDCRKSAACIKKGITLHVINVSKINYFKSSESQQFLDIIINIVDTRLL